MTQSTPELPKTKLENLRAALTATINKAQGGHGMISLSSLPSGKEQQQSQQQIQYTGTTQMTSPPHHGTVCSLYVTILYQIIVEDLGQAYMCGFT